MLTIDASVLVAAGATDEAAQESAAMFLEQVLAAGSVIHQPVLAMVEVTAGIARRTGDAAHARAVGTRALDLPGVVIHALDLPAALVAAAQASDLRLRAADAVYAATALVHGTTLTTLDAELSARAAAVVPASTPAAWLAHRGG